MNEKRTAPRRRNLKIAHIVISEKAPKLECAIRNISESGALLQVSATFGIPTTFDLVLDGRDSPLSYGVEKRNNDRHRVCVILVMLTISRLQSLGPQMRGTRATVGRSSFEPIPNAQDARRLSDF